MNPFHKQLPLDLAVPFSGFVLSQDQKNLLDELDRQMKQQDMLSEAAKIMEAQMKNLWGK